jgi:hypothetical protein
MIKNSLALPASVVSNSICPQSYPQASQVSLNRNGAFLYLWPVVRPIVCNGADGDASEVVAWGRCAARFINGF